jgi:hypothetical protein
MKDEGRRMKLKVRWMVTEGDSSFSLHNSSLGSDVKGEVLRTTGIKPSTISTPAPTLCRAYTRSPIKPVVYRRSYSLRGWVI